MPAWLSHIHDRRNTTQTELRDRQQTLFGLLIERERAFGFNPDVTVAYPAPVEAFVADPLNYLRAQIDAAEAARGARFARAVILTTYGQAVGAALVAGGYDEQVIDMPAGPDHTRAYAQSLSAAGRGTFYLEAVDEMDEKIQPSFVGELRDDAGALMAGMSGSVWVRDGVRYAYVSTVVARPDAPAGTGGQMAQHIWRYLREQSVVQVHLGTQTADGFYRKQGFRVIHTLVPKLRHRPVGEGRIWHDLVIMQKDL